MNKTSIERANMDRKIIEDFEREHHYTLPENYIKFLLLCDNNPQKYCKDYGDISLYSLEELSDEREIYEMDKYCPEYIAIGSGGGGEVLIMKQERDNNTLIVTDGGNLLSQFITPDYCTFFHDFFAGWVARKCPAKEIDSMYE